MIGILLLWFLNLVISGLNAVGCGLTWNETKHVGGWQHFMNWMGAIMAACGFTWCYMVVFGLIGTHIPMTDEETGETSMLLSGESLQAFFELGYMIIILPILGSGLAITINSWAVWWRSRSLGDGAVAGWNTIAQVYNTYSAVSHIPDFWGHLTSFFKSDDKKGAVVIALAIGAAFAGILTTAVIITTVARAQANRLALKYEAWDR